MKPIERRKFFASLHRECRLSGIEFREEPDAGRGSHGSLIFLDGPDAKPVRIVLAYAREISPGVQRSLLRYLEGLSETNRSLGTRDLAGEVARIARVCLA